MSPRTSDDEMLIDLQDVEEALDFCARDLVHPILTKGTLEDVDKFCTMMKEGRLPGRAVLKVSE